MRVRQCVLIVVLVVCAAGLMGFTSHPDSPLPGTWTTYYDGNNVQDLAFDQQGYLWAATTHGVLRWDTKKKTYTRYMVKDGLPSDNITAIMPARDGTVWAGGYGFIVRLKNGKWTQHKVPELVDIYTNPNILVSDILENKRGEVWFATMGAGAIRIVKEKVSVFLLQDGVASVALVSVQEDSSGNMWFNQYNPCCESGQYNRKNILKGLYNSRGISKFDGKNWTIEFKELKDIGDVGFGLFNNEIWLVPPGNQEIIMYSNDTRTIFSHGASVFGLPKVVFKDSTGNIWISEGNSIVEFDKHVWRYYGNSDKKFGYGESSGIYKGGYDWTWVDQKTGIIGKYVKSMAEDKTGTLWFATEKGISNLKGDTWDYLVTDEAFLDIRFDSIEKLTFEEDGKVWIKAGNMLITQTDVGWKTDSSSNAKNVFKKYDSKKSQLFHRINEYQYDLADISPKGDKLLAKYHIDYSQCSENSSCEKYSGVDFTITKQDKGLSTVTMPTLLIRDRIFMDAILLTKDDIVWVGTTDGVFFYKSNNWIHLTKKDGLAGNKVYIAKEAPDGAIWFVTDGGISKYVEK